MEGIPNKMPSSLELIAFSMVEVTVEGADVRSISSGYSDSSEPGAQKSAQSGKLQVPNGQAE
jgi:hypothetical protein